VWICWRGELPTRWHTQRCGRSQNSRYLHGQTRALPLSSTICLARTSPSTILRHRPPVTRSRAEKLQFNSAAEGRPSRGQLAAPKQKRCRGCQQATAGQAEAGETAGSCRKPGTGQAGPEPPAGNRASGCALLDTGFSGVGAFACPCLKKLYSSQYVREPPSRQRVLKNEVTLTSCSKVVGTSKSPTTCISALTRDNKRGDLLSAYR
jgi:hypothetical protein